MTTPWHDPAAVVLLALAVTNALVLASILRRSRVTRPACGRCGYAVRGLEAVRCPECGETLRASGIVTPKMIPVLPTWLLAVLAAVIVTALLQVPVRVAAPRLRDAIDPPAALAVETARFRAKDGWMNVRHESVRRRGRVERATFHLTRPGAADGDDDPPTLRLDFGGLAARTAPRLAEAIETWLREEAGTAEADVVAMARALRENIDRRLSDDGWRAAGVFSGVSVNNTVSSLPRRPGVMPAILGGFAAIWLAAMLLIVRWARRRERRLSGRAVP